MLWKWIRSSSLPAGIIMMIHKKSMLHLVGMLFLCMWDLETLDLETLDFRLLTLLTSDLRCLTSFSLLVSQSLSLLPEYLGKLIIRHISYPAFADGDGHVGEGFFLLDDLIDLFFEGVLGNETVNEDVVLLADAVGAVCRLRLYGGIPPEVVVDDVGGGGKVEAGAGGFQGEDEESRLRVCLEAIHHVFSLPEGAAAVEEHRTFSQPALE